MVVCFFHMYWIFWICWTDSFVKIFGTVQIITLSFQIVQIITLSLISLSQNGCLFFSSQRINPFNVFGFALARVYCYSTTSYLHLLGWSDVWQFFTVVIIHPLLLRCLMIPNAPSRIPVIIFHSLCVLVAVPIFLDKYCWLIHVTAGIYYTTNLNAKGYHHSRFLRILRSYTVSLSSHTVTADWT
jgi:hypothetical protein